VEHEFAAMPVVERMAIYAILVGHIVFDEDPVPETFKTSVVDA
jgi:hypothetical protein